MDHGSNDGDSFRIELADGRKFQFRLYFVDTPETGLFYPDRVNEQAAYFGVSQKDVLKLGHQASDFSKAFLESGTFTVWTEWKDAWGMQKRYAALVYRGKDSLVEQLVAEGLVRIHGFTPMQPWVGVDSITDYHTQLERLEMRARQTHVGGWLRTKELASGGDVRLPVEVQGRTDGDAGIIDLNTASMEDLKSLPGIGPVIADRILQARPFERLEDLLEIKGIGHQLLEALRSKVTLAFPSDLAKTAAFYLANPDEWNGREIELSISELRREPGVSPDGFVKLVAYTSSEGVSGGIIPLYLQADLESDALRYFEMSDAELLLRVRFFPYGGEWVCAYFKKNTELN